MLEARTQEAATKEVLVEDLKATSKVRHAGKGFGYTWG